MQLRTLVLNPWMQPHGIIGWQAAVVHAVLERVDVLEEYDVDCNSPTVSLKIPAVIRLRKAVKMHKDGVKYSTPNLRARDGWRCCYCGRKMRPRDLNNDHVVPRVQGGKTTWTNVVTSCRTCNTRKGSRTPQQAGLQMHFQPYRPTALLSALPVLIDVEKAPEQWLPYLGAAAQSA